MNKDKRRGVWDRLLHRARLRRSIAVLDAEAGRQMRRIGELVYATHTGNPTDSATLDAALRRLDGLKEELRRKERELQAIRGGLVCGACGADNPAEHAYCVHCGRPLGR